jgi:hypothetical protein
LRPGGSLRRGFVLAAAADIHPKKDWRFHAGARFSLDGAVLIQ